VKYKIILKELGNEIFRINYLTKSNVVRSAYIALKEESYIGKSQLEYILSVKAQRTLKDFKKLTKGE
jgi:hypothetical protein